MVSTRAMLRITDLTYRIGARVLLDRATATVDAGRHVGLVGPNGSGKTTLLRLIQGSAHADAGVIEVPRRWRIGAVAQEAPGGEASLIETVLAADGERTALLDEAATATDPHRVADVHLRLADIEAHTAPARAAAILAGLGFDHADQQRPCAAFSGGMRMRVALAAALFARPDLLLLDEPTNHLDLEASLWLEGFLRRYAHTVLLVSHDRDLLNRVVDAILHIEDRKLVAYRGTYDQFEETRRLRLEAQAAARVRQDAHRRHVQAFVDRFRYKASKARQAQSRLKALERLPPIAPVSAAQPIRFDFPQVDPPAPPLVTFDGVAVGYDGRAVLRRLDLRIDPDDRIAVLGANGNGKSTLVKLLARRLEPLDGRVTRSPKLRIGYFAQHQTDELDVEASGLMQLRRITPDITDERARAHLGRFGFSQERADTPIAALSGGEKARLLLALMCREAPNLLLLDEPTNHLDIDSRRSLMEAINAFAGAVVLISHDPHLIRLTADRLWLVADGTCRAFDGDVQDYRALVMQGREAPAEPRRVAGPGSARQQQRRAAADVRTATAPLRRKAKEAEQKIDILQKEREQIEAALADPELYAGCPEQVTTLHKRLHTVRAGLADAEAAWLAVHEALEEAGLTA